MKLPDGIRVVSQEEAEKADLVVCCRVGIRRSFDDDVEATCAHCGHAIFHRPSVPKAPPKVCIVCAIDLTRGGRA